MKLDVDLKRFQALAKRVGSRPSDVSLGDFWDKTVISIDDELGGEGIKVTFSEIDTKNGLLAYKGRQVVSYMPDHKRYFLPVVSGNKDGNKFHLYNCGWLRKIEEDNRSDEYTVINNPTGRFEITGINQAGLKDKATKELKVCQVCISELNYKGARGQQAGRKREIVDSFSLEEFFSTYSTLFKFPRANKPQTAMDGYTSDWPDISRQLREAANYQCQHCKVDLSGNKNLLHVHHIDRNKKNNSKLNLVALCADCHRKQPYHENVTLTAAEHMLINDLRKAQNIDQEINWQNVFKNADKSMFGILDFCKNRKGMTPPIVGYEVQDKKGRVIGEFELAWPDRKEAIYLQDEVIIEGWKVMSFHQALEYYGQG